MAWGKPRGDQAALYPVDVTVEAADRPGLLRDISELFAKEKMKVTGMQMQSVKDAHGGSTRMNFTIEVHDAARLAQVLSQVQRIGGVRRAARR